MARHKLRGVLLIALALTLAGLSAFRPEDRKSDRFRFLRLEEEEEVAAEPQCRLPNASETYPLSDTTTSGFVSLAPDQPSCGYERYGAGLYWATIVVQILVLIVNLATLRKDARPTIGTEVDKNLLAVTLAMATIVCSTVGFALLDRLAYHSFVGDNLYVWDVHNITDNIISTNITNTSNSSFSFNNSTWTANATATPTITAATPTATSTLSYSVLATTAESAVASDETCYRFPHQAVLDKCVQALYETYDCLDQHFGPSRDHYCGLEDGCTFFLSEDYYNCNPEYKYQFMACVERSIQQVQESPPETLAVPFFNTLLTTGWSPTAAYVAANLFRLFFATFQWRGWASVLTRDYMRSEEYAGIPHEQSLCAVPRWHAPLQAWLGLVLQDAVAYGLLVVVLQLHLTNDCLRIVSPMTQLNSVAAVYFPACAALFLVAMAVPLCVCLPAVFVGLGGLLATVAFGWAMGIVSQAAADSPPPERILLRGSLLCLLASVCFLGCGFRAGWYAIEELRRRTKAQEGEEAEEEERERNETTEVAF